MGSTAAANKHVKGLTLSIPIVKIDAARGEVWGYATTEALDQQGEIVGYAASKDAFSEWSAMMSKATAHLPPEGQSLGNLRVMHQPIVAGKAIHVSFDDAAKGVWFGARVNRETQDGKDAWSKVENGELTGFSIGAPYAEREVTYVDGVDHPVNVVTKYKLSEVSLVDNPACPGSFFQEVKLAKGGNLMPAFTSMDSDAEPRGATVVYEPKPTAASAGTKTSKENPMSVEKAGKKIGPVPHGDGTVPGEQRPKTPSLEPMPGRGETGADETDKSVDGLDTGKPGGPHEDASESVPFKEGQGKAAEADADASAKGFPPQGGAPPPGASYAPPHMDVPMPGGGAPPPPPGAQVPPARKDPGMEMPGQYAFCAYCGAKMSSADGGAITTPFHKTCGEAMELKKMGSGLNMGAIAKMFKETGATLEKFEGAIQKRDAQIAAQAQVIEGLAKRIHTLEHTPTAGGPARTDLPSGVQVVEKGADVGSAEKGVSAIEKALPFVKDPFTRDRMSREVALASVKKAQGS